MCDMITAKQMLLDGSAEEPVQRDEFSRYLEVVAMEGALLTAQEAASVLHISPQGVADLIKRRKLQTWELFGRLRVSAREVSARLHGPKEKGGRPRLEVVRG